ncbi:hypothetical protein BS50DRAFT_197207 [Corynespora cassiicola Philippines]|uniref:Uncharacterized protein n=1 Tax=Corynespora cassiicola Philippines TaxID=1448308 RepID=A0A2T2N5S2_CORCC|nr:hypothetical protein BS50DRAFT_197207 [Corynespora cassiicola Philippines]
MLPPIGSDTPNSTFFPLYTCSLYLLLISHVVCMISSCMAWRWSVEVPASLVCGSFFSLQIPLLSSIRRFSSTRARMHTCGIKVPATAGKAWHLNIPNFPNGFFCHHVFFFSHGRPCEWGGILRGGDVEVRGWWFSAYIPRMMPLQASCFAFLLFGEVDGRGWAWVEGDK